MRYKKPKYSNYKKFNNKSMSGRGSGSKKKLIIIIAAIALAIIVAVTVTVILIANNNKNGGNSEPPTIENLETSAIKSLQVTKFPNRLSYYCGAELDTTGMNVFVLTTNGDFVQVALEDCEFSGFDSSVAMKQQPITVTYKGFTDTFHVEIKEKAPAVLKLESIVVETLPKTEYKLGEWLNTTGGVLLCTYTDGTTKQVDLVNKYVSGFKPAMTAGVGEHELTVYYSENGVQVSTTYKITITQ